MMVRKPTISALRAGDESAWRWFCQEFNHSISAYARGKGSSDAENLTGNVMESVARSIHKFNGTTRLSGLGFFQSLTIISLMIFAVRKDVLSHLAERLKGLREVMKLVLI